jgi:hypothetical protein
MALRSVAAITALVLALSGGATLAQDQATNSFYADPVMADPPIVAVHPYPASEATADVAAVAPAAATQARPQRTAACTAINPCAATTPAARG